MKKPGTILLLPLDSRPCCAIFPKRLANIAGCRLIIPPRHLLGNLKERANPEKLRQWYEEALKYQKPSAVIASADLICWGGLVGSRRPPLNDPLYKLDNIKPYLEFPGLMLAFGSCMRSAPTQTTAREVEIANLIIEASEQMGAWLENNPHSKTQMPQKLAELISKIPEDIWKDYLDRRLIKHEANLAAIKYWKRRKGEGKLVFGMDDSKTKGLNVYEASQLREMLKSIKRSHISTGIDETAMLMLVSALGGSAVSLEWSHDEGAYMTGAYEDVPFAEVIALQCQAADIAIIPNASRRLFLFTPLSSPQREASSQVADPLPQDYIEPFIDRIEDSINKGFKTSVADIAWANGSDRRLAEGLIKRGLFHKLTGYAGWNTAGNTIGTALAMLALSPEKPTDEEDSARLSFLLERLADDYMYQSVLRSHFSRKAGGSFAIMSPRQAEDAGNKLTSHLRSFIGSLCEGLKIGCQAKTEAYFPWRRAFEANISITLKH